MQKKGTMRREGDVGVWETGTELLMDGEGKGSRGVALGRVWCGNGLGYRKVSIELRTGLGRRERSVRAGSLGPQECGHSRSWKRRLGMCGCGGISVCGMLGSDAVGMGDRCVCGWYGAVW